MSEQKYKRPQLGTWHYFDVLAIRQEEGLKRWWEGKRCELTQGMFVGYRHKQNGAVTVPRYPDHENDDKNYFSCESTTEVWLFVTDARFAQIAIMPFCVVADSPVEIAE